MFQLLRALESILSFGIYYGAKTCHHISGGIGSRMLPASSMVPKEIMPLIDLPAINYAIEEIKSAGIKNIHIVINEQKKWIIDLLKYNEENITSLQKLGMRFLRIFESVGKYKFTNTYSRNTIRIC